MPFDWMNSGPGQLDLTTPLLAGMKEGSDEAFRAEQMRADIAREAQAKAALGLQSQEFDFQKNMWTSQADTRAAQLDLLQTNARLTALNAQNVSDDHTALADSMGTLDKSAANGDFNSVLNATPPEFQTPQASAQWQSHRNQLLQSGTGLAAVQNQNAQLAIKKADIDTQTQQLQQVATIPNADVNSFYDVAPDGTKTWNKGRAAAAINTFNVAQEQQKAANSASAMAAQLKFQASEYGADTRAKSATDVANIKAGASTANNQNTNHTRQINELIMLKQKAGVFGGDTSDYDSAIQALGGMPQAQPSNSPTPQGIQTPTDTFNYLISPAANGTPHG